ncbi:hypothetical protein BC828DRAFT_391400 [Blastocladiella britannica]|nr:hypothetical protein BC828DRAFT_391400 [Blastocladiella britannica]
MATTAATAARVRLHLPNITFTLTRSLDLPANQVGFHVPQHLTKLDIRQYLTKVYALNIADVRTVNYLGYNQMMPGGRRQLHKPKYKRAIVTLADGETFAWPAEPSSAQLAEVAKPLPRQIDSFGKNSMKRMFKPLMAEVNAAASKAEEANNKV